MEAALTGLCFDLHQGTQCIKEAVSTTKLTVLETQFKTQFFICLNANNVTRNTVSVHSCFFLN